MGQDQTPSTADERAAQFGSYAPEVSPEQDSGLPDGYVAPQIVWSVEATNPEEPDRMHAVMQLGSFDTEQSARQLLAEAPERYPCAVGLRINVISVHRSVEDWLYDR